MPTHRLYDDDEEHIAKKKNTARLQPSRTGAYKNVQTDGASSYYLRVVNQFEIETTIPLN